MALMRRLAAILATDVAGYSRLMEMDEEATHQSCMAHSRDVIEPRVRERFGRIVKSTGDGVLAEFASVFEAVMCAIEIQSLMIRRNAQIDRNRRIEYRIGINMGEVIAEPDDIYGDGVNITARLQALAEPGGLCVSEIVHDQVHNRMPVPFEDFGHHTVKNISRSLHVFGLRAEVFQTYRSPTPSSPTGRRCRSPNWARTSRCGTFPSSCSRSRISAMTVISNIWRMPSPTMSRPIFLALPI